MIPAEHYILFLKFSEYRWVRSLLEGNINCSCIGAFIHQAQNTGNNVQGDDFEGYFAHIKKTDNRLEIIRQKLEDDLDEESDGEYVYLRRKSSLTVPIFCIYGYQCIDAVNEAPKAGNVVVEHFFDDRLFDSFAHKWDSTVVADDRRATYVIFKAQPFCDRIRIARSVLIDEEVQKQPYWKRRIGAFYPPVRNRMISGRIIYDLDPNEEFYIEPDDSYSELLHKRKEYAYQYETRLIMPDCKLNHIFDRKNICVPPFSIDDYRIEHMPVTMEMRANVVRWTEKEEASL